VNRLREARRLLDRCASVDWQSLAIPARNELLDECRRAEQTIEALAEARKDAR
jgi:hypothetical protein